MVACDLGGRRVRARMPRGADRDAHPFPALRPSFLRLHLEALNVHQLQQARFDMAFDDLRSAAKKATSKTPQVAVIVIDDSGSMKGSPARQATEGAQQLVMEMQANNLGSGG